MAQRTLEEILIDLRERVGKLERRGVRRASANLIVPVGGFPWQEWGAKSGVLNHLYPYKSVWARGIDSGGDWIDATTFDHGININRTGYFEVRSVMRGGASGTASYQALAINGDRAEFEARSANQSTMVGVWTHSHPGAINNFSESHYIGKLYTGDRITAGPATLPSDIPVGGGPTTGSLVIRRIA